MRTPWTYYRACIPALPSIDLQFCGHLLRGDLIDVSRKGALLKIGHAELLHLRLPCRLDIAQVSNAINGLVVYQDDAVVGVKFAGLLQAQLEALERLIMSHAGYPQLLDRDVPDLVRACMRSHVHGEQGTTNNPKAASPTGS